MKTTRESSRIDKDLRDRVELAIDYDPEVRSPDIGVAAFDGTVTLTGFVERYTQKVAAERTTKRTYGVKAVANEIQVKPSLKATDTGIAGAALKALEASVDVPGDRIKVMVHDGWVSLEGTVDWGYQRDVAESTVRCLAGVIGVSNRIEITPKVSTIEVQQKIEAALKRHAEIDARRINVTAEDGTIELWGNVRAWTEKEEAERAAWAAPGVRKVKNNIAVVP